MRACAANGPKRKARWRSWAVRRSVARCARSCACAPPAPAKRGKSGASRPAASPATCAPGSASRRPPWRWANPTRRRRPWRERARWPPARGSSRTSRRVCTHRNRLGGRRRTRGRWIGADAWRRRRRGPTRRRPITRARRCFSPREKHGAARRRTTPARSASGACASRRRTSSRV